MLSLMLLLVAGPQSLTPVMPDRLSRPAPQPYGMRMRVVGQTSPMCRPEVMSAVDRSAAGGDLMWREGGEAVGLYRLLERRVNGCSAPIIVNYRIPGSDALGREMGRTPPDQPGAIRRP